MTPKSSFIAGFLNREARLLRMAEEPPPLSGSENRPLYVGEGENHNRHVADTVDQRWQVYRDAVDDLADKARAIVSGSSEESAANTAIGTTAQQFKDSLVEGIDYQRFRTSADSYATYIFYKVDALERRYFNIQQLITAIEAKVIERDGRLPDGVTSIEQQVLAARTTQFDAQRRERRTSRKLQTADANYFATPVYGENSREFNILRLPADVGVSIKGLGLENPADFVNVEGVGGARYLKIFPSGINKINVHIDAGTARVRFRRFDNNNRPIAELGYANISKTNDGRNNFIFTFEPDPLPHPTTGESYTEDDRINAYATQFAANMDELPANRRAAYAQACGMERKANYTYTFVTENQMWEIRYVSPLARGSGPSFVLTKNEHPREEESRKKRAAELRELRGVSIEASRTQAREALAAVGTAVVNREGGESARQKRLADAISVAGTKVSFHETRLIQARTDLNSDQVYEGHEADRKASRDELRDVQSDEDIYTKVAVDLLGGRVADILQFPIVSAHGRLLLSYDLNVSPRGLVNLGYMAGNLPPHIETPGEPATEYAVAQRICTVNLRTHPRVTIQVAGKNVVVDASTGVASRDDAVTLSENNIRIIIVDGTMRIEFTKAVTSKVLGTDDTELFATDQETMRKTFFDSVASLSREGVEEGYYRIRGDDNYRYYVRPGFERRSTIYRRSVTNPNNVDFFALEGKWYRQLTVPHFMQTR